MTQLKPSARPSAGLRGLIRERVPQEQCDICAANLPTEHAHLVEPATRRLICACGACSVLFDAEPGGRYRRVPRDVHVLTDFRMTDQQWEALYVPINLAFFVRNTAAGRVVAAYPSPAGATESLLTLDAWNELADENPVLRDLQSDVEALLVNRVGETREYFRLPIDECYKLVGLIRLGWRGLSGGTEVWSKIGEFMAGLHAVRAAEDMPMPELDFRVDAAEVVPYSVGPLLAFKLRIDQPGLDAVPIHSVVLRCQIRIEPANRKYVSVEQQNLVDLFDRPERWGQTLKPMLWTHTNVMVPAFTDGIVVDLPVPCTFDFNVAATKYFHALDDGAVPLCLLFSGTIFHESEDAGLQVAQIGWDKEATFRLPVRVWKEMMDRYYPNSAWLNLRQDVFDRLCQFKSRHALPSWELALETLLSAGKEGVS